MGKHKSLMILAGIGLATAIVGLCVVRFLGDPILEDAKRTERWPSTTGIITGAKVTRVKNAKGTDEFFADVHYYYYVKDRKYEGTDIHYGGNPRTSKAGPHLWAVSHYFNGAKAPVYYDPANPQVAVLEPGATVSSGLVWFAGWLIAAVGGLLIVVALCKGLVRISHALMERTS